MEYLWSDMHSNPHHDVMKNFDKWVKQAEETCDFWPVAYYPHGMRRNEGGAPLEDLLPENQRKEDWEILRKYTEEENKKGFPMFMGYEWQGSGEDGDHNVFFLNNCENMHHPLRYLELKKELEGVEAIAIPHHLAYQLGSRGKNWNTHDEHFSPFAEIYSSHGCSENDLNGMDMKRHLHMGPRTGTTCYERGLDMGYKVGCIASGDNHIAPAVYDHGMICVISKSKSKHDIWEAMLERHVYGVSRTHMTVDFQIDHQQMGSIVSPGHQEMEFNIEAGDAIDRVEIVKNNIVWKMIPHSGTWETLPLPKLIRVKFSVEFGWGPNPRFYPDQPPKVWTGILKTNGKIISIEKQWNNFGQCLKVNNDQECAFQLTTSLLTATGHWMGPSPVETEGFIFEIEGDQDSQVILNVDGKTYTFTLKELLSPSRIFAEYEESRQLALRYFNDIHHYRDDLIWQNAYKVRVRQGVVSNGYQMNYKTSVTCEQKDQIRLRVYLRNGDVGWTSPIFVK